MPFLECTLSFFGSVFRKASLNLPLHDRYCEVSRKVTSTSLEAPLILSFKLSLSTNVSSGVCHAHFGACHAHFALWHAPFALWHAPCGPCNAMWQIIWTGRCKIDLSDAGDFISTVSHMLLIPSPVVIPIPNIFSVMLDDCKCFIEAMETCETSLWLLRGV